MFAGNKDTATKDFARVDENLAINPGINFNYLKNLSSL